MGLKDEIQQLRSSLNSDTETNELKEAAADVADQGASTADQLGKTARETAAHLRGEQTCAGLRESLESVVADVSVKVEEFPAKYPIITALGALGVGLALGLTVGRKSR